MRALKGTAASPGVAVGTAFVYTVPPLEVTTDPVAPERVEGELTAFRAGRARAGAGLEALVERVRAERGEDLAGVFAGHLEILMDEELEAQIVGLIREGRRCALAAIREAVEAHRNEFLALEDEYLRARAEDLADVGRRLLYAAAGVELPNLGDLPRGAVVVARDLAPSDTARLDPTRVAGFALETGGRTSHTAIMARTLDLPAVVGCTGLLDAARHGAVIALDGGAGEIVLEPDDGTRADYTGRRSAFVADRAILLSVAEAPAATRDGKTIQLAVNIGTVADAEAALPWNPDGVGLFRTEFLFMGRAVLPGEDEQYRTYASVAKAMKGKPVVVRTLDVGGDKPVPAIQFPREENPFLGWRGVRMCLHAEEGNQGVLRTQLRAALRAAADGEIWVMYPMISSVEEVEALRAILAEERARLAASGRRFGEVKAGIMVETPGAALIADRLAPLVDFFSIGSNDLTQYALAADRGNERVSPYYQPFHPAVWRLVASVADAGRARDIPVGICGELAGVEEAALPLVGLGLDELSMSAQSLPRIKRIVRAATMDQARAAARALLDARTAGDAFARATAAMNEVLAPGDHLSAAGG
jgi:phosphotransferase system enzyme I (PtsI)